MGSTRTVLSARVLHYAATSVYWDCEEAHLSDCGHQIDDEQNQLSWGFNDGDLRLFKKLDFADAENFANRWQSSVRNAAIHGLTVPTDRFIAFRGIIKYAEEMTKTQMYIWIVEGAFAGTYVMASGRRSFYNI